jgi:hypothetical protein
MEAQDGGLVEYNGDAAMSPESIKTKLQLPLSCDPPGPGNPPKQLVWIVSQFTRCVLPRRYLRRIPWLEEDSMALLDTK